MFDFRWVDPEFRRLIEGHGLDQLSDTLARADGELVSAGHWGRDCLRLDLPGHPRPLFVKREHAARGKAVWENLLAMGGWWGKPRLEFEVLRRLRAEEIDCPRPLACVQSGPWPLRGLLVLDELAGEPLSGWLAAHVGRDGDERAAFFAALGREAARLHATGFCQPDLYANHILVTPRERGWRFSFLDFQRSRRYRSVPLRQRIRDLGGLLATLPRRLADDRDRRLLLDAYVAESHLQPLAGELQVGVADRIERLLTRRKIWEIRESDTEEHRAAPRLPAAAAGQMWIDPSYRLALEQAGLADFEAMMSTTRGRQMRALRDRENWRLDLPHDDNASGGAYLKKHHVRTFATWVRARCKLPPRETAGRVEAENVGRLGRGGIAAMRLIAYGEKLHADGKLESFVLTEELQGYEQLDHFLRRRFPTTEDRRLAPRDADLTQLIEDVADLAARFHRLGYNHRDLYCCHFFIKEPEPGRFKVNLIDLQRVEHRQFFRRRWLVKDLAQLAYSAPRERVTCAQRMAFIKRYLGVRKLRPADKQFIRAILAKQRLMEWKHGKHP